VQVARGDIAFVRAEDRAQQCHRLCILECLEVTLRLLELGTGGLLVRDQVWRVELESFVQDQGLFAALDERYLQVVGPVVTAARTP
jgi:hypothetical protein